MKILLDESLPRKLRNDFGTTHEVWTVRDKKWLGKKNGELLRLIAEEKFDVFITVDRNLIYQQNLGTLPFSIMVLCAPDNRKETLKKLLPDVFKILEKGKLKKVLEISL